MGYVFTLQGGGGKTQTGRGYSYHLACDSAFHHAVFGGRTYQQRSCRPIIEKVSCSNGGYLYWVLTNNNVLSPLGSFVATSVNIANVRGSSVDEKIRKAMIVSLTSSGLNCFDSRDKAVSDPLRRLIRSRLDEGSYCCSVGLTMQNSKLNPIDFTESDDLVLFTTQNQGNLPSVFGWGTCSQVDDEFAPREFPKDGSKLVDFLSSYGAEDPFFEEDYRTKVEALYPGYKAIYCFQIVKSWIHNSDLFKIRNVGDPFIQFEDGTDFPIAFESPKILDVDPTPSITERISELVISSMLSDGRDIFLKRPDVFNFDVKNVLDEKCLDKVITSNKEDARIIDKARRLLDLRKNLPASTFDKSLAEYEYDPFVTVKTKDSLSWIEDGNRRSISDYLFKILVGLNSGWVDSLTVLLYGISMENVAALSGGLTGAFPLAMGSNTSSDVKFLYASDKSNAAKDPLSSIDLKAYVNGVLTFDTANLHAGTLPQTMFKTSRWSGRGINFCAGFVADDKLLRLVGNGLVLEKQFIPNERDHGWSRSAIRKGTDEELRLLHERYELNSQQRSISVKGFTNPTI